MINSTSDIALITTLALVAAAGAFGQCEVFDLENLSPGTVATNAVPGVTITCPPNTCSSEGGLVLPEIYALTGGPNGTTNVITTRQGCPDFSPDYLRLTFDEDQSFVQFNCGANGIGGIDVTVSWYNQFGTRLGIRNYVTASHVGLVVQLEAGAAIIRRVDVQANAVSFEDIDNLLFGEDATPPTVEIDAPAFDSCVCGDSTVSIVGAVDDPDGSYECDVAEYRPINAAAGEPWTQFGQACGAFTGTLYSWTTIGIPEGRYYLRVTGTNTCGLTQTDLTVVRVDRSFGALNISGFDGGREDGTLCGTVEVLGRVVDTCGVDTWDLAAAPDGGGFTTVATGSSGQECVITEWDTTTVADGAYTLRLTASDDCGHNAQFETDVVVDNSGFCVCGPDINGDGFVDFADILLILANWG